MSDQLLGLPGELSGDGRQGGEVDGHDVGGVAGVLPRPAGSVHRLPVAVSVTGAVTAGETRDPCNAFSHQENNIKPEMLKLLTARSFKKIN